jgi:hypothetical protein
MARQPEERLLDDNSQTKGVKDTFSMGNGSCFRVQFSGECLMFSVEGARDLAAREEGIKVIEALLLSQHAVSVV